MLIAICGPSGSGKTSLSRELVNLGAKEIVSYTTRYPRAGEINGIDYHFITNECFEMMIKAGDFCEYEEYSQNRLYGTSKRDVISAAKSQISYVAVVTPNGMRSIESALQKAGIPSENFLSVMVEASLGVRVKRYIDRVGSDNFSFDDMNEINARVNRDFGMFLNMDKQCDMVLDNSTDYRYNTAVLVNPLRVLAEQIIKTAELKRISYIPSYQGESDYDSERV